MVTEYNDLRAVTYSVFRSAPPKVTLAGCSGKAITPRIFAVRAHHLNTQRRSDVKIARWCRWSIHRRHHLRCLPGPAAVHRALFPHRFFPEPSIGYAHICFSRLGITYRVFSSGGKDHSIRCLTIFNQSRHHAISRAIVDGLFSLRPRIRCSKTRICEVDAAGLIDHQIIGGIESLVPVLVGQYRSLLRPPGCTVSDGHPFHRPVADRPQPSARYSDRKVPQTLTTGRQASSL